MTVLYHKDVFMKPCARTPVFEGRLRYSYHAQTAAQSDRFGNITLPEQFSAKDALLIESEVSDDGLTVLKQVWRQSLDATRDLVLVIAKGGTVKTVWINLKSDKHRTLQADKYAKA